MIRYKLFDNGKGVVVTRQPFLHKGELRLWFEGVPVKTTATVIAENEAGGSYYRQLLSSTCLIPLESLVPDDNSAETVKITVALMDKTPVVRWYCEEIKVKRLENKNYLVAPNDMNLPDKVVELCAENDILRKDIKGLTNKIAAIEQRLSDLLEGYDII